MQHMAIIISWVCCNNVGLLSSIVYKIPDSRRLVMRRKPSSRLWSLIMAFRFHAQKKAKWIYFKRMCYYTTLHTKLVIPVSTRNTTMHPHAVLWTRLRTIPNPTTNSSDFLSISIYSQCTGYLPPIASGTSSSCSLTSTITRRARPTLWSNAGATSICTDHHQRGPAVG